MGSASSVPEPHIDHEPSEIVAACTAPKRSSRDANRCSSASPSSSSPSSLASPAPSSAPASAPASASASSSSASASASSVSPGAIVAGNVTTMRIPAGRLFTGPIRHVRIKRHFLGLEPFFHHGVDLGDGRVAHFSKRHATLQERLRPSGNAQIRLTEWDDFIGGSSEPIEEVKHRGTLPDQQILERVLRLQGRRGYSLAFCNCEHFASFCVCGKYCSAQVEEMLSVVDGWTGEMKRAATDIMFSNPVDTESAQGGLCLHRRPHWTQMLAVAAMDTAANGLSVALDAWQRHCARAEASFSGTGPPESSGHSELCSARAESRSGAWLCSCGPAAGRTGCQCCVAPASDGPDGEAAVWPLWCHGQVDLGRNICGAAAAWTAETMSSVSGAARAAGRRAAYAADSGDDDRPDQTD